MPAKLTARVCAEDGCGATGYPVGPGWRCPDHASNRPRSPSSCATGNSKYKRIRREILKSNPPCHYCGAPATTVDHVIPVAQRPDLAEDRANLVPACGPCNEQAKRDGSPRPEDWSTPTHQPYQGRGGFSGLAARLMADQ